MGLDCLQDHEGFGVVILPLLLSVTSGQGTGIRDGGAGEGAKDQRKQGERRTNTMQQGHQQEEQEHPDTKTSKN